MNRLNAGGILRGSMFLVFFVSAWFLSGRFYPTLDIDHSWQAILEYAAVHAFRFGHDQIFTYGPLGYLNTEYSQGLLLGQRIAFSLVWSCSVAAAALFLLIRLPLLHRLLFITWFILFSWLGMLEQHFFLVLACLAIRLTEPDDLPAWQEIPFVLALAVVSLVKFTFFLAAAVTLAMVAADRVAGRKYKRGIILCASALSGMLLFWLLAGQRLSDIVQWIRGSLQVTSGYSGAMGLVASAGALACGLAVMILFTLAILAQIAKRGEGRRSFLLSLLLSCYAFLTWKHGFVRAYGHVQIFFQSFPFLFAALVAYGEKARITQWRRRTMEGAFVLSLALCLAGMQLHAPGSVVSLIKAGPARFAGQLRQLADLAGGKTRRQYQAYGNGREQLLAPSLLPVISKTVGKGSVDVLNVSLWAAPANRLNYKPRPVIQGYSVYTPWLQEKNREFFLTPGAPEYLLMDMMTIDNRFPALDDGPALVQILANYAPVTHEAYFLLLKRRSSKEVTPRLIEEKQLRFGESMDLSVWNDGYLFAEILTEPTLAGRLAGTLFQTPPVWLDIDSGGSVSRYRFIPAMGKSPFLLSPVIASAPDLENLYANRPQPVVSSFRLSLPGWGRGLFKESCTVRLYQLY